MNKEKLVKEIWDNKNTLYYDKITVRKELFNHPGYKTILNLSKKASSSLDVGCGDGKKTCLIAKESLIKSCYGVDISKVGIVRAKKICKKCNFIKADIENLPFRDNFFDLVYSTFVLEHTHNTEKVLNEIIRVCKPRGKIVLLCPNYGAPNRSSPCYRGSRILKFFKGFIRDLVPSKSLKWDVVEPISDPKKVHISDYDTTVEPYLGTLVKFMKKMGVKTQKADSLWSLDTGKRPRHLLFKFLGSLNLYPFKYWGPQILYVGSK